MNIVTVEGTPPAYIPPSPSLVSMPAVIPTVESTTPPPGNNLLVPLMLVLEATLPEKTRHLAFKAAVEVLQHVDPPTAIKAARAVLVRVPRRAQKTIKLVVLEHQKLRFQRSEMRNYTESYPQPAHRRLSLRCDEVTAHRQYRTWLWVENWMVANTE